MAGAFALLGALGATHAQDRTASPEEAYPAKPVRVIVPFEIGGSADVPGRLAAQILSGQLKPVGKGVLFRPSS